MSILPRRFRWAPFVALLPLAAPALLAAQARVPVEEFQLDNGMRFLAVVRPEMTTVSAGWVAHVGSANERPGITGISHFFEHMMFKGTRKYAPGEFSRIIAELGGSENAFTGRDYTA